MDTEQKTYTRMNMAETQTSTDENQAEQFQLSGTVDRDNVQTARDMREVQWQAFLISNPEVAQGVYLKAYLAIYDAMRVGQWKERSFCRLVNTAEDLMLCLADLIGITPPERIQDMDWYVERLREEIKDRG